MSETPHVCAALVEAERELAEVKSFVERLGSNLDPGALGELFHIGAGGTPESWSTLTEDEQRAMVHGAVAIARAIRINVVSVMRGIFVDPGTEGTAEAFANLLAPGSPRERDAFRALGKALISARGSGPVDIISGAAIASALSRAEVEREKQRIASISRAPFDALLRAWRQNGQPDSAADRIYALHEALKSAHKSIDL